MRRLLLILVALASIAALQPPDETNVPDSEKRIPPGHYCKLAGVTIGPRETHAHSCECTYSCTVDEAGRVTDHEASNCLAFCHLNGRRCTCHPEGEPGVECSKTEGSNALLDMDGRIVAMKRAGHEATR